jgi:hypothetical protein
MSLSICGEYPLKIGNNISSSGGSEKTNLVELRREKNGIL